jgi:hypothetical protein
VNNEIEEMWKDASVAKLLILYWNLAGDTEETHEKPRSG